MYNVRSAVEAKTARQFEIIEAILKANNFIPPQAEGLGKIIILINYMSAFVRGKISLHTAVSFDSSIASIAHSIPAINASYGEVMDVLEIFFDKDNPSSYESFREYRQSFGHHE